MNHSTTYDNTTFISAKTPVFEGAKCMLKQGFYTLFSNCDFTGKELDEETGYGYFGARYMDHELMTGWLSVDPMVDKYPNISPYAYCAWNPMKLVDPNGKEVWIKTDSSNPESSKVKWTNNGLFNEDGTKYAGSNAFVQQTASALDAIYADNESRFLLEHFMGDSQYDIELYNGKNTEYHEAKSGIKGELHLQPTQSISFNPTIGLAQCKPEAEEDEYLAPFICLLHEFGHAFNSVTDNVSFNERKSVSDSQYDNLEEKYVIETYEHPVAARNRMLQRTSHSQNVLGLRETRTSGPLSSIPIK